MPTFTEADIRAGANAQSFERGQSCYRSSAVSGVVRRGNLLTAQVSGSDYEPYEVAVTLSDDGRIEDATCTCPEVQTGADVAADTIIRDLERIYLCPPSP